MGVAKKTRKFAQVKRVISKRDNRRRENAGKADAANAVKAKETPNNDIIREVPQMPSNLFFQVSRQEKKLRVGVDVDDS
ncbi:rRNA-processing protein fcf1 [Diatrype stigma]|uniref:rRNA-processing protein fcf1 n=1 Tax=Diatrype stigma TaxID=117547 RepID=A0AAN9YWQ9_9PEZI